MTSEDELPEIRMSEQSNRVRCSDCEKLCNIKWSYSNEQTCYMCCQERKRCYRCARSIKRAKNGILYAYCYSCNQFLKHTTVYV